MKTIEYGENHSQVIVLLHGGGLSWWNYREEAELLQQKYHVVLPVLDGHADSERKFTSIEDNACELIRYIDEHFNGSVLAICGLSLGGQILAEMLSQRKDICQYAVIESTLVIPMKITHRLIKSSVSASYGLIKKAWFSRLQFLSLHLKASLYEDYYRDSCKISKSNMIAFLQANSMYRIKDGLHNAAAKTMILVGSKESGKMAGSAVLLHQAIKESTLKVLDGHTHGDFSLNHADEYVFLLEKMITG